MGVGLLLPWNAILAAMDFFKQKYPKSLDYAPDFTFLVAVSLPMLLVQLLCFFFLNKIPLQTRMTGTFAVNTVCTILLAIIPSLVTDIELSYNLALLIAAMYGSSVALLQVTLYGVAGPHPEFTISFMVGIGISSFSVNILRIVLMVLIGVGSRLTVQAYVFFVISTLFLALCTLVSYRFVNLQKVVERHNIQNTMETAELEENMLI